MKATDFAKYLTDYLSVFLPEQKNVSKNTILSYRDTFKLLLRYCQEVKQISIERVKMETLSAELVLDFLGWLEFDRNCSISTRNQRLAALHSFFRYVQYEDPKGLYHFQKVISIPIKRTDTAIVDYLTSEAIKLLLSMPDKTSSKGRRDLTLLSVLYDTGARVSELINIKVCDLILENQPIIILNGKGMKVRRVPLMHNTAKLLKSYIEEKQLNNQWKKQYPLFTNKQHNKLTKEGISYILNKYVQLANLESTIVPEHVSPHVLRHSKAMHLLQAGVNLIYIRDFLGHVDIKTTEIYAKADTESKRKAIENAYPDLIESNLPNWNKDKELLSWLSNLK